MTSPVWRKSSRSSDGTMAQCVEVAQLIGMIGIRDSKNPGGGHLRVECPDFAALVQRIKHNELNR